MIKARSIESALCVVVAMMCAGCFGISVGDSQQAENDASITSDTGADESDSESEFDEDDATPAFDPYDGAEQSGTESPPLAEQYTQSSVPSRDASDESAGTDRPAIRLRTAVALPQSLPTGTAMGFSVDYQFTGGTPDSQVKYVWVIKPPSGQVWESAVELQSRGTLQAFVPPWGPVSGNYEMRIDEVTRYGRKPATRPVTATYR